MQATIRERSGINQGGFHRGCGTFRQQPGNVQATIREHFIEAVEHSGDNQGTYRQQSGNVQATIRERFHEGWGTFRQQSGDVRSCLGAGISSTWVCSGLFYLGVLGSLPLGCAGVSSTWVCLGLFYLGVLRSLLLGCARVLPRALRLCS